MKQEHFLRNIEIIDFKCFKNFKAKDFKRVNLISGKNNVGKTSFLEVIDFNFNSHDINELAITIALAKINRNELEYLFSNKNLEEEMKLALDVNSIKTKSNLNSIEYYVDSENGKTNYHFNINNNLIKINKKDFSFNFITEHNTVGITSKGLSNSGLKDYFIAIQEKDKEEYLNNLIEQFDSNIKSFKFLGAEKPVCKMKFDNKYIDLNELGDGVKHYISIICALFASKNKAILFDEIDNGIHYTQLEKLWEVIFTISKEVNCQVFATTHSKEMINAFAKVSQKLEDDDMSFIELGRNKENEIKANVYDKEMFLYELNQNHEVRGW